MARPPRSPPRGKPLWIMGRPRPPIAPLARVPMGRPNRAWMLLLPRRCFKLFWKKRCWGIEIKKAFQQDSATQSAEKKQVGWLCGGRLTCRRCHKDPKRETSLCLRTSCKGRILIQSLYESSIMVP